MVVVVARERRADYFKKALDKENYSWKNFLNRQDKLGIWEKYGVENRAGVVYLIAADGTLVAEDPSADEFEKYFLDNL